MTLTLTLTLTLTGDYAIARSGAVFAENVTAVRLEDNTLKHLGGNAVFLSNSVILTLTLTSH